MLKFSKLIIWLSMAVSLSAYAKTDSHITQRLDELYRTFFKKDGVGCEVLISKGGQVVYEKSFGLSDLEEGSPIRSDSVFRIGSITKQFTAVAVLQLYEQGKLSLNDDIRKYVSDFPQYSNKITIENLLTHTSGITNLTGLPDLEIKQSTYTADELINIFKNKQPDFQPGEKFKYSNSNYILLGKIIERVSGISYADYIKANIFDRTGMTQASYDDPAKIVKHRAKGYELNSEYKLVNAAYLNLSFPYAAGGLAMTVEDYLKWHRALWSGTLIHKETLEKALTPFQLNDKSMSNYGYGWNIRNIFGSNAFEHGGRINGFNAKETYLVDEDILVVTFSNGGFANTDIINDEAVGIVAGKPQLNEIKISPAFAAQYVGTYKFPSDEVTTLTIYGKDGALYLKDSNSPSAWKLHFVSNNEFICYEVFPNSHMFSRNAEGKVDSLVIKNPGGDIKVLKVK